MDCIVHGVTKSRTQLSDFHFIYKKVLTDIESKWWSRCPLFSKKSVLDSNGDLRVNCGTIPRGGL